MSTYLSGKKVAILIANGFNQTDMVAMQKALIDQGANVRIVSPESGIVNGWDGNGWGHNFAVDEALNTVLGADYDMLVVPSGERSLNKLKLTAHSKRFIGSFVNAEKPMAIMDDALSLLAFTGHLEGFEVMGPSDMEQVAAQAGGIWMGAGDCHVYNNLITGDITETTRPVFVDNVMSLFDKDSLSVVESQAA